MYGKPTDHSMSILQSNVPEMKFSLCMLACMHAPDMSETQGRPHMNKIPLSTCLIFAILNASLNETDVPKYAQLKSLAKEEKRETHKYGAVIKLHV